MVRVKTTEIMFHDFRKMISSIGISVNQVPRAKIII